jgi:hypothetical protein
MAVSKEVDSKKSDVRRSGMDVLQGKFWRKSPTEGEVS